jgi:hypothetical protein
VQIFVGLLLFHAEVSHVDALVLPQSVLQEVCPAALVVPAAPATPLAWHTVQVVCVPADAVNDPAAHCAQVYPLT